ncbi:MAG: hypothetical protein FWD68_00950 [Alphaproteobacteria bacterium]|nr:hypothetical protein [Alphaproteobacteria bacterium]
MENISRIESSLVVVSRKVGVSTYDFDFDLNFSCVHPCQFRDGETCVMRIGAVPRYAQEYEDRKAIGLRLVNSPEEHFRASELDGWYLPDLRSYPDNTCFRGISAAW